MAANIPNTVVQLQGRKNISHVSFETKTSLRVQKNIFSTANNIPDTQ